MHTTAGMQQLWGYMDDGGGELVIDQRKRRSDTSAGVGSGHAD